MTYFQRMANIESKFFQVWQDMAMDDSLSTLERSKLAVWDFPISDKFTKILNAIQNADPPESLEEAVKRVRGSNAVNGE